MYRKNKTGRVAAGFGKRGGGLVGERNPLIKGLLGASGPSVWKCLAAEHTQT